MKTYLCKAFDEYENNDSDESTIICVVSAVIDSSDLFRRLEKKYSHIDEEDWEVEEIDCNRPNIYTI